MSDEVFGVYGGSGFGREVMPIARLAVEALGVPLDRLVFVDDEVTGDTEVNGHRIVSYEQFLALDATRRNISIAVSDPDVRRSLARKVEADGLLPWTLRHPSTQILDAVELGPGAVLCSYSMITSDAVIGRHFHANIYSYVAHDCSVGDFVTLAPRACINGNVVLEDRVSVGTGAMLRQGVPGDPLVIGEGAVIGMGAVVTKSVPPGETVVGNPARPISRP